MRVHVSGLSKRRRSQAAGQGCEVLPGVGSPFISPPPAFTVYGTKGQFRNILDSLGLS